MTRINVVPPSELSTKHLVAEYRELPRIFGLVEKAVLRGERPDDPRNPTEYRLGTGHVRFFYNKLWFLIDRYHELVAEMYRRGFNPQYATPPLGGTIGIDDGWWQDYSPTEEALALNRQRIAERGGNNAVSINRPGSQPGGLP